MKPDSAPRTETDEIAARRAKVAAWRARKVDPYPHAWPPAGAPPIAASADVVSSFRDDAPPRRVSVAGRLVAIRRHGKATFGTLRDAAGDLQVYWKVDAVGAEAYESIGLLDVGDWVGATGTVFRTRMGEVTVAVEAWAILSKALRPLPDKWHGLEDIEVRSRRRHLDLVARPEARRVARLRSCVVRAVRRFLDARGFLEVETPMMQPIPGGAAARPFATRHNALDCALYLRVAPELYLKRLLVGGLEKVYELNRCFRNEGIDRNHNPEFTMLEAYWALAEYGAMMELVEEMVSTVARETIGTTVIERDGAGIDLAPPWRRVAYRDLVKEHGSIDAAEPTLVQPTFVIDFPVEVSPLAKRKRGDPALAERFEPYVAGMEIGNAFTELNDPDEQRARFEAEAKTDERLKERAARGEQVIDEDFLEALAVGMPPAAGLGLGIDRLVMLLAGARHLRDVILFPTMRPPGSPPRPIG